MKPRHFFNRLDHERLTAAIRAAETGTSGDLVLYVTHRAESDALAAADRAFARLRLDRKVEDDGLLIFVAPKSRTFAVVGGKTLHEKVGQAWWDALLAGLRARFRAGEYTEGLLAAIVTTGEALRLHFPATGVNRTGQVDLIEE